MINRPRNWDNVQAYAPKQQLPVGAYVCKIKRAVVQQNTNYGDQLCVLFDISDGEYSGFYNDDFQRNTHEDKKWKGVLRQFIPVDDGSENDERTKSAFKGFVTSVEESNRGYTWNWDERSLAGKEIGIIFRREEWEYNGKSGWTVRPFRACSVDTVQDGTYTLPKDKPLKNKSTDSYTDSYNAPHYPAPAAGFTAIDDSDGELPF